MDHLEIKADQESCYVGSLISCIVFILCSGFAGWASSHEAWQDGKRLDIAPWGEDLRFRNRIAENENIVCFAPTIVAAIATALTFRKKELSTRNTEIV